MALPAAGEAGSQRTWSFRSLGESGSRTLSHALGLKEVPMKHSPEGPWYAA